MNKKTVERVTAGFLYLFVFVMLGITVWLCWNESFWSDEAFSLQIIKHSYASIIKITAGDVHPPLYYFILKFIVDMVRFLFPEISSVIVGKCVSVLPVLILIVISWFVVRNEWGLLTAAIFAMSVIGMPHLMYYAIEIRMYSWGMLFVTLAFLEAYRVTKYRKTIDWVWFTVFGLCAAYTQYFALIEVAFAYLYLLVFFIISDRKRIKEWLIIAVVTIVCYLPWLGCVISQVAKVNQEYWIEASGFSKVKDYIIYIACPEIVHSAARLSGEALLLLFAFLMLVKVYNTLKNEKYGGGIVRGFRSTLPAGDYVFGNCNLYHYAPDFCGSLFNSGSWGFVACFSDSCKL